MRLRLWPRRESAEPTVEAPATPVEPATPSEPSPAPPAPPEAPPEELPATLTLTIDEAKSAIRAAGGDVIQVGFLASAYRRAREEDPASTETAAAGDLLTELVGKRLRDCKRLAPAGIFELRDD